MDDIIKKAISGNKAALAELYNQNKDLAFATACTLIDNKETATNIASNVFSTIWKEIKQKNIQTTEEFSELCNQKIVLECKKIILQKNSKAFQKPANQNFIVSTTELANSPKEAFTKLPPLQKFIFVCRVVYKMKPDQIAKIINLDTSSVKLATNAEKMNIEKNSNEISLASVEEYLMTEVKNAKFPMNKDSEVLKAINVYALESKPREAIGSSKKSNSIIIAVCAIFVVALILSIVLLQGKGNNTPSESNSNVQNTSTDDKLPFEWVTSVTATDYAVIDIKDYGKISVALDSKTAPITVENFKSLAKSGFYNGLTFHRIMKGFMMQGGDPDANGMGGSDKEIKGEFYSNGVNNNLSHVRGAISMARSPSFDSASSQFFIVHKDSNFLDKEYAAFGYVVDGMDVVDAVCKDAKPTDNNGTIPFKNQPIINSITIYTVEEFENYKAQNKDTSDDVSKDESSEVSESTSDDASVDTSDDVSENTSEDISIDKSSGADTDESIEASIDTSSNGS